MGSDDPVAEVPRHGFPPRTRPGCWPATPPPWASRPPRFPPPAAQPKEQFSWSRLHAGTTTAGRSPASWTAEPATPCPRARVSRLLLDAGLEATLTLARQTIGSGPAVPLADVQLLAPLVPATIRDFVAFEEHVEGIAASIDGETEVVPEWYEAPTFYFTNPHTVLGTGEAIGIPAGLRRPRLRTRSRRRRRGRAGQGRPEPDGSRGAPPHLRLHDHERLVGARPAAPGDEGAPRAGKGKDFGTTLGPWIVTADEFERPVTTPTASCRSRMAVEVNGEPSARTCCPNMGWPFAELVAYASQNSRGPARRCAGLRHRAATAAASPSSGDGTARRLPAAEAATWSA